MSQAKPYTISLAVEMPDGCHRFLRYTVAPTGSSSINQDSFLMLLQANLTRFLLMGELEVLGSSQGLLPSDLGL